MAESNSPLKTAEHQTVLSGGGGGQGTPHSDQHSEGGNQGQALSEPMTPDGPTYRELKHHSLLLQNNLKELKDNYQQIEHQIHSETQK